MDKSRIGWSRIQVSKSPISFQNQAATVVNAVNNSVISYTSYTEWNTRMKKETMAPTKNKDMESSKIGCFKIKASKSPISDQNQAATSVKEANNAVITYTPYTEWNTRIKKETMAPTKNKDMESNRIG